MSQAMSRVVQGQSAAAVLQGSMNVVRGPSQDGKTTFINDLMLDGGRLAVGDGSGESCTEHTVVRQTVIGPVVDGPGDQDSRLTISNEEAGRRYAREVFAGGARQVRFLVFEGLDAPARRLRSSLASLQTTFGPNALQAAVVVASRADMVPDSQCKGRRLQKIRDIMTECGLDASRLICWQHFASLSSAARKAQLKELQAALGKTLPTTPDELQTLLDRQRERAQQLYQRTAPRQASTTIQENYVHTDYVKVKDKVEEEYQKEVPCEVSQQKQPDTFLTFMAGTAGTVVGGMLGGLAGGPAGALAGATALGSGGGFAGHGLQRGTETVTKTKMVTCTRVVDGPERDQAVYTTKSRDKTVSASYKLQEQDFMAQALQEILAEDRNQFAQQTRSES